MDFAQSPGEAMRHPQSRTWQGHKGDTADRGRVVEGHQYQLKGHGENPDMERALADALQIGRAPGPPAVKCCVRLHRCFPSYKEKEICTWELACLKPASNNQIIPRQFRRAQRMRDRGLCSSGNQDTGYRKQWALQQAGEQCSR
ncbi:hypothetical protein QYF61_014421 [Mycteria americana]|uniref:Uncharacterized protein n=1 Tax=Mycteria americana TaxID=33587 RepID=A0AAN7PFR5_MYCAM|nr:hypothetical protein QYF61_014421 [Mycteria americana]